MAMNSEIKAKWVEALRSGRYKQGKGQLKNGTNNSFCCLGVFCEIMEYPQKGDGEYVAFYTPKGRETVSLRSDLLGVEYFQKEKVMTMNDSECRNFAEIADYIEEHF